MARVKFITPEEVQKINELYDSGKTAEEIAHELYISVSSVYRYVKKNMKVGRRPALNAEQIQEVNRMYQDGKQIGEIMIALNIHYDTARKAIKDYKVYKRLFNTIKEVQEVNRLYEEEKLTIKQIAQIYGVSPTTIGRNIWHPRNHQS